MSAIRKVWMDEGEIQLHDAQIRDEDVCYLLLPITEDGAVVIGCRAWRAAGEMGWVEYRSLGEPDQPPFWEESDGDEAVDALAALLRAAQGDA